MDAEGDLKPGEIIGYHPNENSGNRPTENDIGWWHDDLRLLVTVGGTEYLFEKLKTEDHLRQSDDNMVTSCYKKSRNSRSPIRKQDARPAFQENVINGLLPTLNQEGLCVKPEISNTDINDTV